MSGRAGVSQKCSKCGEVGHRVTTCGREGRPSVRVLKPGVSGADLKRAAEARLERNGKGKGPAEVGVRTPAPAKPRSVHTSAQPGPVSADVEIRIRVVIEVVRP